MQPQWRKVSRSQKHRDEYIDCLIHILWISLKMISTWWVQFVMPMFWTSHLSSRCFNVFFNLPLNNTIIHTPGCFTKNQNMFRNSYHFWRSPPRPRTYVFKEWIYCGVSFILFSICWGSSLARDSLHSWRSFAWESRCLDLGYQVGL